MVDGKIKNKMLNRIIVLALLFLSSMPTHAEEQLFSVQIVREIKADKNKIYSKSNAWIAETFRSAKAVIEHTDKDAGLIIGNGVVETRAGIGIFAATFQYVFKFKEEIKDNKFRFSFSDVKMITNGFEKPIESTNRASTEPEVNAKFNELADSLAAYITAAKTDW